MRNRITLVGVSVAIALASLATGASAAGGRQVYIANRGCTGHAVKPSQVILTCADANSYLSNLKYTSYGSKVAKATGTLYENPCNPDCASSKPKAVGKTAVTFKDIITCDEGRSYYGEAIYKLENGHSENAILKPNSGCAKAKAAH